MTVETPPARFRYVVVGVTALAAVLLYLDRVCISALATYMRERLGLTAVEMSYALGAFFFSYALAQVPSGWLSDRFGARLMLTVYILSWSLFTALTGLATGLVTLLAMRLAVGLAQAGAYPTAAGLVSRWVPLGERGLASGIVSLGGRIGGATAPILTALLLIAFVPITTSSRLEEADMTPSRLEVLRLYLAKGSDSPDFRVALRIREFLPDGEIPSETPQMVERLNLVIAEPSFTNGLDLSGLKLSGETKRLLQLPSADRSPQESERLNRLVLETAFPETIQQLYGRSWREVLILYGAVGVLVALAFWFIVRDWPPGVTPTAAAPRVIPWMLLIRNRNMWLSGLMQFGVNVGWVFVVTLLPTYLAEMNVPLEERGTMQTVLLLVGSVGMFLGGPLTDRLTLLIGKRWGRALPIGVTQLFCALVLMTCPFLTGGWGVVIALTAMAVAVDLGVPAIWAFAQDVGGRNVGAAVGWGNMWGNLGEALSPVLLTRVQIIGGWSAVFVTCSVAFLVASTAGLFIDARQPLDPSPSATE